MRGWATDLLGPKIPALDIEAVGDSVSVTPRGQYVALGGLARWDGSVELQLPLGFLQGRHYGLLFLDAGRVWTPDSRFLDPDTGFPLLSSDDGAGYAAGGGLSFRTPVGAIRLMAGYKLNPTPLDVRDPLAVGEALLSVGSAWQEAAPASAWRRWRIHLDIGTVF